MSSIQQEMTEICMSRKVSPQFIKQYFQGKVPVNIICQYQNITIEFIEDNMKYIDFKIISQFQYNNLKIVERYADQFDWDLISTKKLSIAYLQQFEKYINWGVYMRKHNNISINILLIFAKHFDFDYVSQYYTLSPEIMRALSYFLNWNLIAIHQKLDENTICEFIQKLDKKLVLTHQECRLSYQFKNQYKSDNVEMIYNGERYIWKNPNEDLPSCITDCDD